FCRLTPDNVGQSLLPHPSGFSPSTNSGLDPAPVTTPINRVHHQRDHPERHEHQIHQHDQLPPVLPTPLPSRSGHPTPGLHLGCRQALNPPPALSVTPASRSRGSAHPHHQRTPLNLEITYWASRLVAR